MKTYKKTLLSLSLLLLFGGALCGAVLFTPTRLGFKIRNQQGIQALGEGEYVSANTFFQQAIRKDKELRLIAENNELMGLYEQKKYQKIEEVLNAKLSEECSLERDSISEFCENIYYLEGLLKYRLGEEMELDAQKEIFEKSILAFQKVLTMNPENQWAKENIDFIKQKFQETQEEQQAQESGEDGEPQDKDSDKEDQKSDGSKSGENSEDGEKKDGQKEGEGEGDKKQDGENGEGEPGDESGENDSRLPEQMQDELSQKQKQLEQGQQQSQEGFNRSESAAEKNNQNPFTRSFFGTEAFRKKNFNKNKTNPDEKDW